MDLNTTWFLLIGVFLTGYAILDGFDLGVGILHLFARNEHERQLHLSAIGPLWDGNEVWLIAGAGSLFAVFPAVYATLLSAFYLPFILLLVSLISRAVSIEFRNKESSQVWQYFWDRGFCLGSLSASFLFGLMLGNIIKGLPVDRDGALNSAAMPLFNLYSILIGLLVLTIFTLHGGIYLAMKTGGAFQERMRRAAFITWIIFIILYPLSIIITYHVSPFLLKGLLNHPVSLIPALLQLAAIIYILIAIKRNRPVDAFISSSSLIAAIVCLLGLGLFPLLTPSSIDPLYSLTVYNASAGTYTLFIMLIIAAISLPPVIAYSVYVHSIFKGKVDKSIEEGY